MFTMRRQPATTTLYKHNRFIHGKWLAVCRSCHSNFTWFASCKGTIFIQRRLYGAHTLHTNALIHFKMRPFSHKFANVIWNKVASCTRELPFGECEKLRRWSVSLHVGRDRHKIRSERPSSIANTYPININTFFCNVTLLMYVRIFLLLELDWFAILSAKRWKKIPLNSFTIYPKRSFSVSVHRTEARKK